MSVHRQEVGEAVYGVSQPGSATLGMAKWGVVGCGLLLAGT